LDKNDFIIFAGIGAVIAGLILIYWPTAIVFGGLLLMAVGLRRTGGRKI
jgi:hypothetical protein